MKNEAESQVRSRILPRNIKYFCIWLESPTTRELREPSDNSLARTEKAHATVSRTLRFTAVKLTRNNPRDMQDVQALAKKLGLRFDLLVERFQTEMSWVPNRARHRLTLDAAWKDYFDPAV